jgi:hypothetical protein
MTAAWKQLANRVQAVPQRIFEKWNSQDGWDNDTQFGKEYGENFVSWCVIFIWCMYHDSGFDAIVPKTDNVTAFSNWAKKHGQWSEYPSVGAWVNLNDGGHTEVCVGFDEEYMYSKGGNSIKAGASDGRQGNGVWEHKTPRRSSKIVGYFAPRFPDGVCPPTADPHDYRGGKAQASYHWVPDPSPYELPPFPGADKFKIGATNRYALELQTWLARGNWGPKYNVGPSTTMARIDIQKIVALQEHYLSDLGPADGIVGPKTWKYAYDTAYGFRKK